MSFRRAFSSLGCPEFTLEQILELAARHRLDAVELRAVAGRLDLPAYFAATYESPEAFAETLALRKHSAPAIVALDTSFRLVSPEAGSKDLLLDFVPWADAIGVKWLRVFDGGQNADEVELTAAAQTLNWWREERERLECAVDLMVETHDSLFTASAIQRFQGATSGCAILWDSHHTWKRGGEDPVKTWAAIRDRVVHIHVKDSMPVPSGRHPFTYVLPGTGEFPIQALVDTLRSQYHGTVSLEWEKLWHPYLPALDEALTSASERSWW